MRNMNNRAKETPAHAAYTLNRIEIETPLGEMTAVFGGQGLCLLEFTDQQTLPRELQAVMKHRHAEQYISQETAASANLRRQLAEYFAGRRQNFDIPLDLIGTPFQQQVWRVLQTIPYGDTRSYKQQAQALGNPKAVRAVAAANGANKISIIVPCHRVIGSKGALTGYAGGLPRKQALLALESGRPPLF
ncbi:MAG: methylated-DNA--[protein]-cysteine S-methyltransferase [Neisseria sp.]|nr:methylated-DNA--[protein]-cysteine S-methyltransferase [Neisseria sp.]